MHPVKLLIRPANAQADQNLLWVHISEGTFSDVPVDKMIFKTNVLDKTGQFTTLPVLSSFKTRLY